MSVRGEGEGKLGCGQSNFRSMWLLGQPERSCMEGRGRGRVAGGGGGAGVVVA